MKKKRYIKGIIFLLLNNVSLLKVTENIHIFDTKIFLADCMKMVFLKMPIDFYIFGFLYVITLSAVIVGIGTCIEEHSR